MRILIVVAVSLLYFLQDFKIKSMVEIIVQICTRKMISKCLIALIFLLGCVYYYYTHCTPPGAILEYNHPIGAHFLLTCKDGKYFGKYECFDYKIESEMPENVVKSKNCEGFMEWQDKNIPPTFPKFPCPWEKLGDTRKVEIGDLRLNIPRSRLALDSKVGQNGKANIVMFRFPYHEKEPGYPKPRELISVWMEDITQYIERKIYENMDDYLFRKYWHDEVIDASDGKPVTLKCIEKKCMVDIIPKGFDQATKRNVYVIKKTTEIKIDTEEEIEKKIAMEPDFKKKRLIRSFHEDDKEKPIYFNESEIFTNDNPRKPKDFIVCNLGKRNTGNSCYAMFAYKNVFFKLDFSKNHLNDFNDIKEYLLGLIKIWGAKND